MNCHEVEILVQQFLDGERTGLPTGAEAHLALCTNCVETYQAAQLLLTGMCHTLVPEPDPIFTQRVVNSIIADRRQRYLKRYRVVAAAAAAVLLIVVPALNGLIQMPDNAHSVESRPGINSRLAQEIAGEKPTLQSHVERAGQTVVALTDRLAGQTRIQAELVWRVSVPEDIGMVAEIDVAGDVDQTFSPAAESLQKAGNGLTAGLQPVADSARSAVNFFVREMPGLTQRKVVQ